MPPSVAAGPAARLSPTAAPPCAPRSGSRAAARCASSARSTTEGVVQTARVVARGDVRSVLALPGFASRGEMLVHNHPSGLLEPSGPDLEVAARMHDDGIGFGIVDNDATELYVVVEVPARDEFTALDPIADRSRPRPGRRDRRASSRATRIARASARWPCDIARLYNDGGVGLLEAGTGVGKSLGYLVPALRWAAANGERTVVSTNTINLQEQLVGKDLPFLARALGDQTGALRAAQGMAQLSLPRATRAGARRRGNALFDDGLQRGARRRSARGPSERRDGSLRRSPIAPRRRSVGRGRRRAGSLPARCKCPALRQVLSRSRRAARRRRPMSSSSIIICCSSDLAVRRAHRELGRGRGAARVHAARRRRRASSRGRGGVAPRHDGDASRAAAAVRPSRPSRQGTALGAHRASVDRRTICSAPRASISLQSRLAPAVQRRAREEPRCSSTCSTRSSQQSGRAGRATHATTSREHPIWKAGLRVALDDTARRDRAARRWTRSSCASALRGERAPDEAVMPLLNEMRAVTRRLAGGGRRLASRARPAPVDEATPCAGSRCAAATARRAVSTVPLDLAPILREDLFKRVDHDRRDERDARHRRSIRLPRVAPRSRRAGARAGDADLPVAVRVSRAGDARRADATCRRRTSTAAGHSRAVAQRDGRSRRRGRRRDVRRSSPATAMFARWPSELRARGADRRWPCSCTATRARDALLCAVSRAGRAILLGTASFWEGVDVPGDALRGAPDRQAALPRAHRADHRRALRGDRGSRRRLVPRVHAAARRAAPQAGLWPPHPHRAPTAASW